MNAMSLDVDRLTVEFVHDGYAIRPLDELSFRVEPGRLAVLLGPSGSGKTTLLSVLGGLLTPTSGTVRLGDLEVNAMDDRRQAHYRRQSVGFVFQAFNLIPSLSARENVAVPLLLSGVRQREALARAESLLGTVGLEDRMNHHPAQLSGGQQQRVAIARGLIHDPPLLLADEPTANLDHIQAEAIIGLLRDLRDEGRVVVISTHDARLLPIADDIVRMTHDVPDVVGPPQQVRYEQGESIFEQGDHGEFVYVIEEGEVDIVRVLANGDEKPLATLDPGQYFGELAPMLGFPRSASARARTSVVLTAMGITDFRHSVTGT